MEAGCTYANVADLIFVEYEVGIPPQIGVTLALMMAISTRRPSSRPMLWIDTLLHGRWTAITTNEGAPSNTVISAFFVVGHGMRSIASRSIPEFGCAPVPWLSGCAGRLGPSETIMALGWPGSSPSSR